MTPHDSTRCAVCGNVYDDGTCGYPIHEGPALPTEGVGAVDFAGADSIAEFWADENGDKGDTYNKLDVGTLARAYLALRAPVPSGVTGYQVERARRAIIAEFERNFREQSEHEEDCDFDPCRCDKDIQGIVRIHNASRRNFLGRIETVLTAALAAAEQGGG